MATSQFNVESAKNDRVTQNEVEEVESAIVLHKMRFGNSDGPWRMELDGWLQVGPVWRAQMRKGCTKEIEDAQSTIRLHKMRSGNLGGTRRMVSSQVSMEDAKRGRVAQNGAEEAQSAIGLHRK